MEKILIKARLGSATSVWEQAATTNKRGPAPTLIKCVVAQRIWKWGGFILVPDYYLSNSVKILKLQTRAQVFCCYCPSLHVHLKNSKKNQKINRERSFSSKRIKKPLCISTIIAQTKPMYAHTQTYRCRYICLGYRCNSLFNFSKFDKKNQNCVCSPNHDIYKSIYVSAYNKWMH